MRIASSDGDGTVLPATETVNENPQETSGTPKPPRILLPTKPPGGFLPVAAEPDSAPLAEPAKRPETSNADYLEALQGDLEEEVFGAIGLFELLRVTFTSPRAAERLCENPVTLHRLADHCQQTMCNLNTVLSQVQGAREANQPQPAPDPR